MIGKKRMQDSAVDESARFGFRELFETVKERKKETGTKGRSADPTLRRLPFLGRIRHAP
jgi:hypothetical protein